VIDDSIPWKDELVKVADRLDAKTKQKRWSDRTGYLIERDFMVSAFAMRRLIDAHKVSDSLRQRQIPVVRFDLIGNPPDLLGPADIEDSYDFENGRRMTLVTWNLCQQFIHSFVLTLSCDESPGHFFDGVYMSSDFDKGKFVYLVRATDYIALCRDIGVEDIYSKSYLRGSDGQMRVTEILGRPYEEPPTRTGLGRIDLKTRTGWGSRITHRS
jgi:hypothetical protein